MLLEICTALAMATVPAENYNSWFSPEIAEVVKQYAIDGKYYTFLDYNGDGDLNIADVVGISRHYKNNVKYGNEIMLDTQTIYDIAWENYSSNMNRADFLENDLLYYEIMAINGKPCRYYDITVTEVTEVTLYFEFADHSDSIDVRLDPFKEMIRVL